MINAQQIVNSIKRESSTTTNKKRWRKVSPEDLLIRDNNVFITKDFKVSDQGDVISIDRETGSEYLVDTKRNHEGYRRVKVGVRLVNGEVRTHQVSVHALICAAWHGKRPSLRSCARHLNGDPLDDRCHNLKWGTQAENNADKVFHGRTTAGKSVRKLGVTEQQKICFLLESSGLTYREIARALNVSVSTVKNYRRRYNLPSRRNGS